MANKQELDCAVCMQKYNHPAKLPCDHIFCFLCVKGVFLRSHTCPMCRTPIPEDYLDNPVLVNEVTDEDIEHGNKYWWYYEGKDGWWSYDERSNEDIESDFNEGKSECKLLVAGAVYCVDFNSMIQYRQADPRRKRKVKRDTNNHPCKGIAGIRKMSQKQDHDVGVDTISHNTATGPQESISIIEHNSHNPEIRDVEQENNIEEISHILRSVSMQESEASTSSTTTEET